METVKIAKRDELLMLRGQVADQCVERAVDDAGLMRAMAQAYAAGMTRKQMRVFVEAETFVEDGTDGEEVE